KRVSHTRSRWLDLENRTIVKRMKPLLLRYRHLRVDDGESYYYQQLLLNLPWRSEEQLKGPYRSYREHHAALFPRQHELALALATHQSTIARTLYMDEYQRIVDFLVTNSARPVQEIINEQLLALQRFPVAVPRFTQSL